MRPRAAPWAFEAAVFVRTAAHRAGTHPITRPDHVGKRMGPAVDERARARTGPAKASPANLVRAGSNVTNDPQNTPRPRNKAHLAWAAAGAGACTVAGRSGSFPAGRLGRARSGRSAGRS